MIQKVELAHKSFHSISFPSEWGPGERSELFAVWGGTRVRNVSIQLVSPASGDSENTMETEMVERVSIQLVSPASGDPSAINWLKRIPNNLQVSIQLVSPASGDQRVGTYIIHPIQRKMSRGHLRGGRKLSSQTPQIPPNKTLKPLPSNISRGSTTESMFQRFAYPLADFR